VKLLQRGFTFIEVMVAVGIFAVIATVCYATVSQYLKVTEALDESTLKTRQLQRTFTLIERDFRFMVNRPVRDEYGDQEAAFMSETDSVEGEILRVTVSEPSSDIPGWTQLSRIGWRLVDGSLYRDRWLVLDRVQDTLPQSVLVLTGVAGVQLVNYEWSDDAGVQPLFDDTGNELPYATELVVQMDDDKEYRRLFDLANGT